MKKRIFTSAVIVAAGDGVRMGGVCKGLLEINGVTAFERVLSAFCGSEYIDEIICVCKDDPGFGAVADAYAKQKHIKLVRGGEQRHLSVFNGVSATDSRCKVVCIHDCARPFVTTGLINTLISAAVSSSGASCVSSPVTDTVKYITDGGVKTPNRSKLFAVQTPQVFTRDMYLASFAVMKKNNRVYTDETSMAEAAGFRVEYVDSREMNMKLTSADDLTVADAYARKKEKTEDRKRWLYASGTATMSTE